MKTVVSVFHDRRHLRSLLAMCTLVLCSSVFAQAYPLKPVRILVGFPPGQASDILARILSAELQAEYRQTFIVENRPGAGGTMALAAGAKNAPDGYTLIMSASGAQSIAPNLYPSLAYDPVRDFTPIALIATIPQFIYAHPSFSGNSVRDLVDSARRAAQPMAYASSGYGLPGHIIMELLGKSTQAKLLHVPYKGSVAALTDVIGNQVSIGMDTAPTLLQHHRAGEVKILGVTSKKRTAVAPEVVPLAEQGLSNFDYTAWIGIVGPANMPPDIASRLSKSIGRILAKPEISKKIVEMGMDPSPLPQAEFRNWIAAELIRWKDAVKVSGATVQ